MFLCFRLKFVIHILPCPIKEKDTKILDWEVRENALYSYILSRDIIQNPDDKPDESNGEAIYTNPKDSIYYFSIKESFDGTEWSSPQRYRILQDQTAPEHFEILIGRDTSVHENKYFATFATVDKTSGIDHYELAEYKLLSFAAILDKKWKVVQSPYPLFDQKLRSIIKVKAIDKAGNERVALYAPTSTRIIENTFLVVLLLLVIKLALYSRGRWNIKPKKL